MCKVLRAFSGYLCIRNQFTKEMNKTISTIAFLAASAFCCTACSDKSYTPENENGDDTPSKTIMQTTTPVPSAYFQPVANQGKVEVLHYESKDYTRADRPTTRKPAYIYLSYGYDASKKYDIIYLLHGWTGTAEQYFGMPDMPQMKNLFDNMIAQGLCKPFIAVSPTWDKDNQAKGWGESTQEAAVFSNEYINDLIPAVESHYSTYAETTDDAGLLASRAHRALGGFSLGAITTWYVFEQAFPYTRWYLPMSGDNWHVEMFGGQTRPRETAEFLASLVNASPYKDDFYVWYAVGSDDVRLPQTHNQAMAMAELSETFNARNFSYHQKPGGRHDFNAVWEFCYHALQFFFPKENAQSSKTYTRTSRIADVMADPSFADFGRLIFPVNRGYWSGNTLEDLGLTWYSHIDPDKTVEIINDLKTRAEQGETVFYSIYTEAEKTADPQKRDTGLFFFRGKKGARFAVCNAGGGFSYVGAMHDSFPHALELSKRGYNAFALIYRPGAQTACEDLARAISFIFAHAEELGVDTNCYSLWGGSAGARMAAWLGSYGAAAYGGNDVPRAGTVVMQYTGLSEHTAGDPPTYACVGDRDGIANWQTMKRRIDSMAFLGIPTEFHVYSGLGHGFGLGTGTVAEGWFDDAVRFWEKQMK